MLVSQKLYCTDISYMYARMLNYIHAFMVCVLRTVAFIMHAIVYETVCFPTLHIPVSRFIAWRYHKNEI